MANKNNRYLSNAPGKYYVDHACIACDACTIAAPANFKMNNEAHHSELIKQPSTPEEAEKCAEALAGCPVEAIGDDGEETAELKKAA